MQSVTGFVSSPKPGVSAKLYTVQCVKYSSKIKWKLSFILQGNIYHTRLDYVQYGTGVTTASVS